MMEGMNWLNEHGLNESTIFLATIGILAVLTVGGILMQHDSTTSAPTTGNATGEYEVTDDGRKYTVHPSNLIWGCSGRDCIPAIDDPAFQPADQADWLHDEDLILGIEQDGVAKAYPLRVLTSHEIVNDRIGGQPIIATYCPLCRSALVYSREVAGSTLTFGVSGRLYNANLVMYDRETDTLWSQIQGEAIVGELVPAELDLITSTVTEWSKWRDTHPDTQVLSRDQGIYPVSAYGSNPYASYFESDRVGFGVNEVDDRLHAKELVFGVTIGDASKAYEERVIEREDVINDEVGGVPVLLVEDQQSGGIEVFIRRVGDETVTFSIREGRLVDDSGNAWSFTGVAQDGPHTGEQLERLNSHGFFWFAWSTFHPDTGLYKAGEG